MNIPSIHELGWQGSGIALAVVAAVSYYASSARTREAYAAIPTVGGPSSPFLWFIASYRFFRHGTELLQEGYTKYKGRPFKVALGHRWLVVVPGRTLVEEVRRLPADVMSLRAAGNALIGLEQTLGKELAEDTYMGDLSRSLLKTNPEALYVEIHDEITHAFELNIPSDSEDWLPIPAFETSQRILCAINGRTFVGLPLCRQKEWIDCTAKFGFDMVLSRLILEFVPKRLKSIVRSWCTPIPRTIKRAGQLLAPRVEALRAKLDGGDDAPGGLESETVLARIITHLESDNGGGDLFERLVVRIMLLSMIATHATNMIFAHALYTIAADPSYLQELRDEAEQVIAEHGHTRQAVGRLRKADSFLKEVVRFHAGGLTLVRIAQVPCTFSDGTTIPAGALISAAQVATHRDVENYAQPDEFIPSRFVDQPSEDRYRVGQSLSKTSAEFLPFGHGRYACPGRFYAANILKMMFVHLILHYDVKAEEEGVRPKNIAIISEQLANSKAKIMFRKRRT